VSEEEVGESLSVRVERDSEEDGAEEDADADRHADEEVAEVGEDDETSCDRCLCIVS
jgi:hypothetical protein